MARKRFSEEDVLNLLRQIDVELSAGSDVASACRKVGISDVTYYTWRRKYGGMAKSQLQGMKSLEKENARLKRIVADLELDKLILKETLDYLKSGRDSIAPAEQGLFRPSLGREITLGGGSDAHRTSFLA